MSTMESELDAELDCLARATMAAWDGEPSALRLVTSQARPEGTPDNMMVSSMTRPRPTLANSTPCNVIDFRRPVRLRPV